MAEMEVEVCVLGWACPFVLVSPKGGSTFGAMVVVPLHVLEWTSNKVL